MKTAYLDCFSGVSGDMFLGALLDAGFSLEELVRTLSTMPLTGYRLTAGREGRNHLHGTRVHVHIENERQKDRGLREIQGMIQEGDLSPWVKQKAIEIFQSIAVEEGKIHGCAPEEVHFHEIGAVDSIIDIVGVVYGLECLGISALYSSPLPLGTGFAETRHGRIPLPAPATAALLKGIPVYDAGLKEELVTPTGAALVKGLAIGFGPMPPMVIEGVGYGVGSRRLPDRPNLLRVIIGEDQGEGSTETIVVLETNVDDANPEWLGFLMDRLLEAGALDVAFCPVHMKKNRPGIQIQVIGTVYQKDELMALLFRESTTLGVRFHYSQRKVLERSPAEVESPWGKIRVKKVKQVDGTFSFIPEFETCRSIAVQNGIPLKEVYARIISHSHQSHLDV